MATYQTVLAERQAKYAREAVRGAKQAAKDAKFKPRTDLHPAVGVLMKAKGVRYYAYVNGTYREGTPEHLAALIHGEVAA